MDFTVTYIIMIIIIITNGYYWILDDYLGL